MLPQVQINSIVCLTIVRPSISNLLSMLRGKPKIQTPTQAKTCLKIPVPKIQHVVNVARKVPPTLLSLVHSPLPKPAPIQLPLVLFALTMKMSVALLPRVLIQMVVVRLLLCRRVSLASH